MVGSGAASGLATFMRCILGAMYGIVLNEGRRWLHTGMMDLIYVKVLFCFLQSCH